jgi:hypothetical protein
MAELRLTVGALNRALTASDARAAIELEAYARKLGADVSDSAAQKADRILHHLANLIRRGAYEQLAQDALIAAQNRFEEENPLPSEWGT